MPEESTLEVVEATIRWKIREFSVYKTPQDVIRSKSFCDNWSLDCDPMHIDEDESTVYVSIYLCSNYALTASYELSVLDTNLQPKLRKKVLARSFVGGEAYGFPKFGKRKDILSLLSNDTLTISCSISSTQLDLYSQLRINEKEEMQGIAKDLEKLLLRPEFRDIDICVNEEEPIPAHKCLLAARSPVFEAMFTHNMSESQKNKIVITDLELDVVKEMLHYIYTGQAPRLEKLAERLFFAADKYQLCELRLMCEKSMVLSICAENTCRLFLLSIHHNLQLLKESTSAFATNNMKSVMDTSDFDSILSTNPNIIKKLIYSYVEKHD